MNVLDIYNSVCSILLERGGLQLGLVTNNQFLSYYTEIMLDFLQQSGLAKTIAVLIQQDGIEEYDLPDLVGEPEHVISQGQSLGRSDESDMANASHEWRGRVGYPRTWRQDKGSMKKLSLSPIPALAGNAANVTGGILGTLSVVVPGADVDITCDGALFGTIGGDDGPVSVISPVAFFGTIASIQCSKSNIAVIASASLFDTTPDLGSLVEWLQPSFALYIKYGILWKIFSMDGECKDETRGRYCRSRYEEGIALAQTIMTEEMQQEDMAHA